MRYPTHDCSDGTPRGGGKDVTLSSDGDSGDNLGTDDPDSEHRVELLGQQIPATESQQPPSQSIRVLLVIDMNLVRGAFVALLSGEDGIEVVDGLALSEPVLPAALCLRPDVTVLDVDGDGPTGLATALQVREQLPTCRVVALVSAQRPGLVRRALDLRVAGAVDKDAQPGQLPITIRRVAQGQRVIDPTLAIAAVGMPDSPLTHRELAVLDLAAGGASPSEIARRLRLSAGTVRNYLSRATRKMGGRSRIDAIRIARDAGWL